MGLGGSGSVKKWTYNINLRTRGRNRMTRAAADSPEGDALNIVVRQTLACSSLPAFAIHHANAGPEVSVGEAAQFEPDHGELERIVVHS